MEIFKQSGKTLGFSIAGGRGSTPAYEDVDEVIYNSHINVQFRIVYQYIFRASL